jgi:7-cyano-7-deazaguanine tRNA-ribosyltransferase
MFELKERDGLARVCRFETGHGIIETPTLLPVINPNQITISPKEMADKLKVQAIITNSYIILKTERLREKALGAGLHSLVDFEGPIMTDSGTFQSHVYGDVEVKPDDIIEFQKKIGSDIGTVLDIFSEPDDKKGKVAADLKITIQRTKEAAERKGKMLLAGPVQGGRFPDLRRFAAEEMSKLACDVFPIGGVVPMMECQRYSLLADVVMSAKTGLDPSKPVHLFGCGHPMLFSLAVLTGCDMFDSSAYAKYAKEDRLMFSDGTRFLGELAELGCHCPVCSGHTLEELRSSPEKEKLLAMHNLYVSYSEIRKIKQAIHEGRLWELAEARCRAHPHLMDGLKKLHKYTDFLERHEPLSRELAFMYTSQESYRRPAVSRFKKRLLARYSPPKASAEILFPETGKPYSRTYSYHIKKVLAKTDAHFWVDSFFCPVPIELDEVYPVSQSVIPEHLEKAIIEEKENVLAEFKKRKLIRAKPIIWQGAKTLKKLKKSRPAKTDLAMPRAMAVSDIQFGKGAGKILLGGKVELVKSKNTGRIKNVLTDGQHVLSMRATDGYFTLKFAGGQMLKKAFKSPALRVIVHDDSAEFNVQGRNVFAGFVLDADPDIAPGDEVLVMDKKDKLVAIGRALLTRDEMLAFKKGIAVKVREGLDKQEKDAKD